jgi:hypothetical protein
MKRGKNVKKFNQKDAVKYLKSLWYGIHHRIQFTIRKINEKAKEKR